MRFCTVINCMDGRVQLPVINYLRKRFATDWVDNITEAGPNGVLALHDDEDRVQSIMERLAISLGKHDSNQVAVVGHHDCAGNPGGRDHQTHHIRLAVEFLRERFPTQEIIGLWVDENWQVTELDLE